MHGDHTISDIGEGWGGCFTVSVWSRYLSWFGIWITITGTSDVEEWYKKEDRIIEGKIKEEIETK